MMDTVFFYVFALLTLGGGVLCITRRNAVHSAISLIASLLGVAGLYLLQHAEFLFAVQIIL
ncbi:MAG: NADH-quinone oxidoreductase subunit J, partial [Acidobacteria bacterium]|nr:NADH-quinone oxidoreductase subunit J [Acidobacteriota bacterium]